MVWHKTDWEFVDGNGIYCVCLPIEVAQKQGYSGERMGPLNALKRANR